MITEIYMQLAGVILAIIYIGHILKNLQLFLSLPSNSGARQRDGMQQAVPAKKTSAAIVQRTGSGTATGERHGTALESTTTCEPFQDAQLCPTGSTSTTYEQHEDDPKRDTSHSFAVSTNQYCGRFGQSTPLLDTRREPKRLIPTGSTIKDVLSNQLKWSFLKPSEGSHQATYSPCKCFLNKRYLRAPGINHQTQRRPPEVLQGSLDAYNVNHEERRGPPPAIMPRSSSLRSPSVSDQYMKHTPAAMQGSTNTNSPAIVQQDQRESSLAIPSKPPFLRSAARTFPEVDRASLQRSLTVRPIAGNHEDMKQQPAVIQLRSSGSGQAANHQDGRGPSPGGIQRSSSLTATALKDQAIKQPPLTLKSSAVNQPDQRESPLHNLRYHALPRSPAKTFYRRPFALFERQAGATHQDTKEQSAVMPTWPSKTSPFQRSLNHEIDKMSSSAGLTKHLSLRSSEECHQQIAGTIMQRSSSLKSAELHRQKDAVLERSSTMRAPGVNHEEVKEQHGTGQRSFESHAIIHHDGEQQPADTEKRTTKSVPDGSHQESAAFDRSFKLPEVRQQYQRGSSLVIRPRPPLLRSPALTSTAENHQNTNQKPAIGQQPSTRPSSVNHQDIKQQPNVLQTSLSKNSTPGNHQEPAGLQRSSTLNHQDRRRSSPAFMQRSSSLRPAAVTHQSSPLRSSEGQRHQSPTAVALPKYQSLLSPERYRQNTPVQIALPERALANRNRKYVTWKSGEAEELSSDQKSRSTSTGCDSSRICHTETCMWSARPTPESPRSHQKRLRTKGIRKFLKAIGQALSGKPATRVC